MGGRRPRRRRKKASIYSALTYVLLLCSICRSVNEDGLVEASNGSGFIHKSKLNTNGSFSVGKTWRLAELHGIQVLNVSRTSILVVCLTMVITTATCLQYNDIQDLQMADRKPGRPSKLHQCHNPPIQANHKQLRSAATGGDARSRCCAR